MTAAVGSYKNICILSRTDKWGFPAPYLPAFHQR